MLNLSTKNVFIGIVLILALFGIIWIGAVSFTNNNPGFYKYTIDISGLDRYQSSFLTDIIVPLPVREGQQVFSDEEVQYRNFGNWKSILVMTEHGKMLGFQSTGRNLTDLHAAFERKYPEGDRIRDITSDSLSPVIPYTRSPYTEWIYATDSVRKFSTSVSVPDTVQPLSGTDDRIHVRIELIATGGTKHSFTDGTYRVVIDENLPAGARNMTNVTAQIGILDDKDLNSGYRWIPLP